MSRPPIVLVHGAWAGVWDWRRVLAPLRASTSARCRSVPSSGDRRHLLRPDIGLHTHAADVVGCLRDEELRDVVLVGHSYAGLVITAAAHMLAAQAMPALRQLVYVDAMVPLSGESWGSRHPPEIQAARTAAAAAQGCNALPPPDPGGFGLAGADRDWLLRRQCPHPFGAYRELLPRGAEALDLPRAFIDCIEPAYPTIDPMRARVRELGFAVATMRTGHYPQIQQPAVFVEHLLGFIR